MGLRDKLTRLEKAMQDNLSSIELADGSHYWFDPQEVGIEMFMYWSDSLHAIYDRKPRPEPPEIVKAVANAKDRERAVSVLPLANFPLKVEALVKRGEFVPRPLVAGYEEDA